MNNYYKSVFTNSKGLLMIEFMFGMVITFVIMLAVFRVCYSLLVAEVAQYIAYSTARAHAVSDINLAEQRVAGMAKYKELKTNAVWKHLFSDAFAMNKETDSTILRSGEDAGGGGSWQEYLNSDADGSELSGVPFIGVVLGIKLSWLNMNIPFLGQTADSDQEFKTKITAFMLREPSSEECKSFFKERYNKILELDPSRFVKPAAAKRDYVALEDNGC